MVMLMKYPETARRLASELELKEMNQQTLAEKSGVNKASISQYVNGTHMPSVESAKKMAKVLGVNYSWLLGHSDYRTVVDAFAGRKSLEDFMKPLPEPASDKYEKLENYLQLIGFTYEEARDICRYARFLKNEREEQS